MPLATLTVDFVAKLAGLQTAFDKAAQLSERNAKRIQDAFKNVGTVLKTATAAFSAQQLIQAFNAVADGVAKFKDVAESTGIAVEELSKLEPVARQAGLSLDDVGRLSLRLTKALAGIDGEDSGVARALKQIGLNADELRRLQPAEQLQAVGRALNNFADDGNKAAVGQRLLSKEWQNAAGFLKDLGEQGELVASVTKEQADQADAYAKAIERLKQQIVDLARGPILTAITFISNEIGRLSDATQAFGSKAAGFLFNLELAQFDDAAVAVNQLNDKIVELQRTLEADPSAATLEQRRELDRLIKSREFYLLQLRRQQQEQRKLPSLDGGGGDDNKPKPTSPRQSEAERFLESLQRQAIAANYTAEQILRIEAAQKGVADAAEPWIRSIEAAKEAAEDTREINEFLAAETRDYVQQQSQAVGDYLSVIDRIAELEGRLTSTQEQRLELYQQLLRAGKITEEQFAKLQNDLYGIEAATDAAKDAAKDFGFTFSSAIEDAIVSGGNLRDLIRSLEQDILRMVTRLLVTEPLGNAISGGLGRAGATFSGGGSFFDSFADAFIKMFGMSAGGPVMSGKPYLIGEKGPELFVPNSGGTIVPNQRVGNSITINIAGSASRETANQIAAAVSRQLRLADARAF